MAIPEVGFPCSCPCAAPPWRGVLPAAMLAMAFLGCGRGDRVEVRGRLTCEARPVPSGTVSLVPAAGQTGPAVMTYVRDGQFHFDTSTGPQPGPHRVLVLLGPEDWQALLDVLAGQAGETREPLPVTRKWQFQADVPQQGPMECEFVLE